MLLKPHNVLTMGRYPEEEGVEAATRRSDMSQGLGLIASICFIMMK